MSINLALIEDAHQAGNHVGVAVAKTRIGVCLYCTATPDLAIAVLEEACDLFRDSDKRGLGWASMHLAFAYSLSGDRDKFEETLSTAVNTNSEYGFCGEHYFWMCERFYRS